MGKKQRLSRAQSTAFCGLAIALMTVSAWIFFPFGVVLFTLQTFAILLVLLTFPPRQALISIFGYLLLGAVGLPVFSGMKGGLAALLGPTGGFLFGFALGAVLAVMVLKAWKEPRGKRAKLARLGVAAGVLMTSSYVLGCLQFMCVTDMGFVPAFVASIAPFIVPDVVKAAAAVALANMLRASVPALRVRKS